MGILLNVGSRDETQETSGSCMAIKQTYLKTLKHTNETINYGMIQMTGGECDMEYDEETMFFHAYSFEYDVTDVFRMLGDMAFEPRSILAANVKFNSNLIIILILIYRLQEIKTDNTSDFNIISLITIPSKTILNYSSQPHTDITL